MNNKDKKIVDEQEKLLDHLIEYGGRQYIDDKIKKYEELPELEPSKEFDDKMHRMFKDAYKEEVRHERIRFGKRFLLFKNFFIFWFPFLFKNRFTIYKRVNIIFFRKKIKQDYKIDNNRQSKKQHRTLGSSVHNI